MRTLLCGALAIVVLAGCGKSDAAAVPRFELRWCTNGEKNCVLTQKGGPYVRGGYFASLDRCNDAIRHVSYYGAKLGGTCVEITDSERQWLDTERTYTPPWSR